MQLFEILEKPPKYEAKTSLLTYLVSKNPCKGVRPSRDSSLFVTVKYFDQDFHLYILLMIQIKCPIEISALFNRDLAELRFSLNATPTQKSLTNTHLPLHHMIASPTQTRLLMLPNALKRVYEH